MKNIYLLILSLFLISCLPKEIREKKRCNKKLERLVEKCPQLLNKDTIHDTIHVVVPELLIKDSLFVKVDTFRLEKLVPYAKIKEVLKHISIDTTINHADYTLIFRLSNGLFSHDITIKEKTIEKPIETVVDVVKPNELTWYEKLQVWYFGNLWITYLLLILFLLLYLIKKFLNKLPFN